MSQATDTILRYRPWKGELAPPQYAVVALARAGLRLLLRRKLFWALYALALMIFFFFFYGQYLVVWIQDQTSNQTVMLGGMAMKIGDFTKFLDRFNLNGSPHTFANFIWFEGYICTILLALAGSIIVGNDFHHGSMPFYLAKPISPLHYVLGKCLTVGVLVNLMTTIPALILYIQAGLLYDWKTYYLDNIQSLFGILGYGLAITCTMSLLLVTTSVLVRRTVPMIMIWSALFVLCRTLGSFLVEGRQGGQGFHPSWRLIDLWNNLYLIGVDCLGADRDPKIIGTQPDGWQAALVCLCVCIGCILYLRRRVRAVDIIR